MVNSSDTRYISTNRQRMAETKVFHWIFKLDFRYLSIQRIHLSSQIMAPILLVPNEALTTFDNSTPSVFTGIFYSIQRHDKAEGTKNGTIDGWNTGEVSIEGYEPNFSHRIWAFRRTAYDGYYAIQRHSSDAIQNRVLDGWGSGKVSLEPFDFNHPHRSWTLSRSIFNEHFGIKRGYSPDMVKDGVLNGSADGKVSVVTNDPSNPHMAFKFIPQKYELSAVVSKLVFDSNIESMLDEHSDPVELVSKMTIPNNSDATISIDMSYSKTLTSEYSYGFDQSFSFTAKTEVKAKVPFLVENKVELESTVVAERNKQWTNSVEDTYSISQTVEIPPHKSVRVLSYVNWIKDISVPFKATMKITGVAERLKIDGTEASEMSIGADVIKSILKFEGFDAPIIGSEGDAVLATVTGTFKGSYGLDTFLSAEPYSTTAEPNSTTAE